MAPEEILVVCTANVCRSPVAAALLTRALHTSEAGTDVRVTSAGTHAVDDDRADDGSARRASDLGLDLSGHRSRPLHPDQVRASALVLTMTTEHRRQAIRLAPERLDTVFTWLEFSALAEHVLARIDDTTVRSPSTAARAAHRARPRVHVAPRPDIDDPVGRSERHYRWMIRELARGADAFMPLLVDPGPP